MHLPIIADNEGDLILFDTLVEAERYLEPVDVSDGGWVVYDAWGGLLLATVYSHPRGLKVVRITDPVSVIDCEEELSVKLRGYLARNWPKVDLENKALPDLIDAVRPYIKAR